MLSQLQIAKGINAAMYKAGISGVAYIQRCPANFNRPSYYINAVREVVRSDNRRLVRVTSYFTITCFPPLVEHQEYCTVEALLAAQSAVMSVFRPGYLRVEDRAITVQSSSGGNTDDRAYVELQAEYYDDRAVLSDCPKEPIADHIVIGLE
ncbi:MAG TPA: hypothetical protein IAD07_04210 [Candidatus Fimivicinus intestinavium]|nr:hypothetical protein [Candidatus Fimivicinus intestinavium]